MSIYFQILPVFALLARATIVNARNVTCASSSTDVFYNSHGRTPCELFESLYRTCEDSFRMFTIQGSPTVAFAYYCQPDRDPSDYCCCNSVSYALFSACKSCQQGTEPATVTQQTYKTWLGSCSKTKSALPITNGSLSEKIASKIDELSKLPPYAYLAPTAAAGQADPFADYRWSYAMAEKNATATKSYSTKRTSEGLSEGAKAGIVIGVLVLVALIGVGIWKGLSWYRERRRRRGDNESGGGGLDFKNPRRSILTFGMRPKTEFEPSSGGQGPWREMRDETSNDMGDAPAAPIDPSHDPHTAARWEEHQSQGMEEENNGPEGQQRQHQQRKE